VIAQDFPRTIGEISEDWLSQTLGAKVASYEANFLEGGVLSDAFKVGITYDGDPGEAPTSVVLKMAKTSAEERASALMTNSYTKELRFFEDLLDEVPITAPKLYASFSDGSATSEFFLLVMEDLTQHSLVFDQVSDPPNAEYARKIAMEAAKLHAQYWESETTKLPWIGRPDGRYVFGLDELCKLVTDTWGPFRELWQETFGADIFSDEGDGPAEELTDLICGPKSRGIHEKIYEILSSRPMTVLHGDMRADNVFRTDPAAGKSVEDSTITFIDWQVIHAGPPGPEFTEAWMHSLEPEVRRHDKEFLREYHDRLVELNPAAAAYTYEMLIEDYTLSHCFWWTAIITIGINTLPLMAKPEGARMKALWGGAAVRLKTALIELDCLSLVKSLAADLPDDAGVAAS
jgi:hypothetical protein